MIAREEFILFPIGFAHRPRAFGLKASASTSFAIALMIARGCVLVARGELNWFPIGFAHRPRGFGLQARAATSFAAYLPLLAAWFSA